MIPPITFLYVEELSLFKKMADKKLLHVFGINLCIKTFVHAPRLALKMRTKEGFFSEVRAYKITDNNGFVFELA